MYSLKKRLLKFFNNVNVILGLRLYQHGCRLNRKPGSRELEITEKALVNKFPYLDAKFTTLAKVPL